MEQKKQPRKIIIDRPEKLGGVRRKTEWGITTMGWVMWFLFCRPFVLIFLWFLGVQVFYEHMVRLGGLQGLREVFGAYLGILLMIFLLVRGWNLYNFMKFRGKDRRQKAADTSVSEMERFFKVQSGSVRNLQDWPQVHVDFSPDFHQRLSDASGKSRTPVDAYFHPSTQPPHPKN